MNIAIDEIVTEITDAAANITEAAAETAAGSGGISWGGLFLIIALGIIIIIWAVSRLVKASGKKNISEDTANSNSGKIGVIPETSVNMDINENEEDETELVAVITAAVASVLKKPVSGFRVVSFKKRNSWK